MRRCETNSPGLATLGDIYLRIGNSQRDEFPNTEWNSLVLESNRLLKFVARHARPADVDNTAHSLAKIIQASSSLGGSAIHNEKARAGKRRKTDRRWKIIRCAIVWVCLKQKLTLSVSDCFAESIRNDVIEAAKRFGLFDLRTGTSIRSIVRHISALLKDRRLVCAILESEELAGLF